MRGGLLGEQIIFVANLPAMGAHVLVGSRAQRFAIRDLILIHRGTAVLDETKVHVCTNETDEQFAVAGRDPDLVFAAPGFTPRLALAGGSEMRRIQGLDRPRPVRRAPEALRAPEIDANAVADAMGQALRGLARGALRCHR